MLTKLARIHQTLGAMANVISSVNAHHAVVNSVNNNSVMCESKGRLKEKTANALKLT